MRHLTERQHSELDRIASAGSDTTVVGWALGGPVLRIRDTLVLLKPPATLQPIEELEGTRA